VLPSGPLSYISSPDDMMDSIVQQSQQTPKRSSKFRLHILHAIYSILFNQYHLPKYHQKTHSHRRGEDRYSALLNGSELISIYPIFLYYLFQMFF
jgi:hypothetical protein